MAQAPSRCLNHPDRTAVARCKQCHKPICEKCAKKMPGGVYCSDECYQKMLAFQDRVKKLDEARKSGSIFGKIAGKFGAIAVVLIVVAVLYYVFVSRGVRSIDGLISLFRGLVS